MFHKHTRYFSDSGKYVTLAETEHTKVLSGTTILYLRNHSKKARAGDGSAAEGAGHQT